MTPAVVLLAHGSPDPRHRDAIEAQAERLRAQRGADVRCAYLETDEPSPATLGAGLTGEVVVVPMLITPAYHARVDVPAAARDLGAGGAAVTVTGSLGPDPLLLDACRERLTEHGLPADRVLLVAGGSSDGQAAATLAGLLADHGPAGWSSTTLADAASEDPGTRDLDVPSPPVVVPFVLAEGVLHDKVATLADRLGCRAAPGGLLGTDALDALVARRAGMPADDPRLSPGDHREAGT